MRSPSKDFPSSTELECVGYVVSLTNNNVFQVERAFLLEPRTGVYSGPCWEILDLKLPDVPLISQRRFHPRFSSKVLNAIAQLRDYRSLFARPDLASELRERFGAVPLNPKLAILVGSIHRVNDRERCLALVAGHVAEFICHGISTHRQAGIRGINSFCWKKPGHAIRNGSTTA